METVWTVCIVEDGTTVYICRNEEVAKTKAFEYVTTYGMEMNELEILEEELY
jgi:ABC-type proline/glycine betaine transport system ATPase subunit